ncbi:hypothetical protein [Grimontia sp. SpTr1]|uniref:hypothetical protein n=1 Tax=Grimontia sp. SpTr1 TaxID=2995319 RepID=UPI00248C1A53|nr:hypothetical protein [Grimontia sp. SpTr1]
MKLDLMSIIKNSSIKKAFGGLLAISTLLGGYVAVVDILGGDDTRSTQYPVTQYSGGSKPYDSTRLIKPIYEEDWIAISYGDLNEFRSFLDRNVGKIVSIHSSFSFDTVLAENHLAHEVCDFEDFIASVVSNPDKVSDIPFGMPRFLNPISSEQWQIYYDTGEYTNEIYRSINCLDQIRLVVKDPRSLRLSYGGTGTISLPIWGDFLIEQRALSGPRIEYTLREM